MIEARIFSPNTGNVSYTITATSSASIAFTNPDVGTSGASQVRVCASSNDVFITWGDSTDSLTAAAPTANSAGPTLTNPGGMRLKSGVIEVFSISGRAFAVRSIGGSTPLDMTFGNGL